MNPITHFLAGWAAANGDGLGRRERVLVTLAGVVPDVDGIGIVGNLLTQNTEHGVDWWENWHHVFAHNLPFGLLVAGGVYALARARKGMAAALALVAFHLHVLGDVVGGRGPEGYTWPIPYLWPFSNSPRLEWSGQWALNAWPNFVITGTLLAIMFYVAWKRGYSPLEMISPRVDAAFVSALRARFGYPTT